MYAIRELRVVNQKDWRWAFLRHLAQSACVSYACMKSGVSRDRAYEHRARFPKFRKKWEEALVIATELLEVSARYRALNSKDPASHTLMMFLLKGHKPHVYRDNYQPPKYGAVGAKNSHGQGRPGNGVAGDLSEPDDGEMPDLSALSEDELNTLASITGKLAQGADPASPED